MALPKKGDRAVRAADGARFTVDEVIEAGGEEVYRLQGDDGEVEVTGASFVREHDQTRAEFEIDNE